MSEVLVVEPKQEHIIKALNHLIQSTIQAFDTKLEVRDNFFTIHSSSAIQTLSEILRKAEPVTIIFLSFVKLLLIPRREKYLYRFQVGYSYMPSIDNK